MGMLLSLLWVEKEVGEGEVKVDADPVNSFLVQAQSGIDHKNFRGGMT